MMKQDDDTINLLDVLMNCWWLGTKIDNDNDDIYLSE